MKRRFPRLNQTEMATFLGIKRERLYGFGRIIFCSEIRSVCIAVVFTLTRQYSVKLQNETLLEKVCSDVLLSISQHHLLV